MNIQRFVNDLRKKVTRRNYKSGWQNTPTPLSTYTMMTNVGVIATPQDFQAMESKPPEKIEKKPVEVVNELLITTPVIDLLDIKKKIKVVELRIKTMKKAGGNISNEVEALGYLKARAKYTKYGKLFSWNATTSEKIDELLKKYKLFLGTFGDYSRNVPQEGVDEIERFCKAWNEVVDSDSPCFQLIVDEGGKEMKKDPILLAPSPFGKWYYILGAWDKEVEYVDELIYKPVQ